MPILVILGVCSLWGAAKIIEYCGSSLLPPLSNQQLDDVLCETCGKSQQECKHILKKYKQ